MTREEAINQLQDAKDGYEEYLTEEAINMAIQALSQEPTEKPMCDRNICISNEYNGIGCDECIVNKAEQEPTDENLHREREQAYMQGYEDASKRFRQEPCEKCLYAEETDGSHCYECVKGESKFKQEPCDDAISREDVIKLVECSEYELQDRVDNDAMCDDVRKLPSVTQKSGKWTDYDSLDDTVARLNKEGWEITRYEYKRIQGVLFEMANNCGANMESEE